MLALVHPHTEFRPRECQVEAKAAFWAYTGKKGALVVLPTGVGKTALGHYVLIDVVERGGRVLWLADQKILVKQPFKALAKWWPDLVDRAGVVMAGKNQPDRQIVYASKDTVRNDKRMDELLVFGEFDLVVVDEAHKSMAKTWQKVIHRVLERGGRLLGITATPAREDNKRLSDLWDIVYSYPILTAIYETRDLVPAYAAVEKIPGLDLSNVRTTSSGDYNADDLERELLKAHIVEHTVTAMQKTVLADELPFREKKSMLSMEGRLILVHTAQVEQARLTAEALTATGKFNARFVCGETPDTEQRRLYGLFEERKINVLCSANLLSTGVDFPAVDGQVFAAPTRSWVLFMQRTGRGLRTCGDKPLCYLLDLVNCTKTHSIVGAPVLVDGMDCDESDDGAHHYLPIEGTGEGRCQDCGKIIKCMLLGGSHDFQAGHCKACKAPQCEGSPNKQHHWIPWEDNHRACIHCGKEVPDPMAAMIERRPSPPEPVIWHNLGRNVWGVDLGKAGQLLSCQDGDGWRPWLYTRETLVPLAPKPVDARMVRLLCDDVARQSVKMKGWYGGSGSESAGRITAKRLEALARRLRVWEQG